MQEVNCGFSKMIYIYIYIQSSYHIIHPFSLLGDTILNEGDLVIFLIISNGGEKK